MSIDVILTYVTVNFLQLFTVGTLGVLLGWFIPHLLSKSRDKENFNRSVDYEKSEIKAIILSHLGVFANGILNCWEEGTVLANSSKHGSRSTPLTSPKKVEFEDYEILKHKLVELGVFDAKVWHTLDQLPGQINKINESIKTTARSDVFIHCYHFSENSKVRWEIVREEYVSRGGNMKELTPPMPVPL